MSHEIAYMRRRYSALFFSASNLEQSEIWARDKGTGSKTFVFHNSASVGK